MNCKKFAILILSCIFTFTVCFTSFAQLDVHNVSIRKEGTDTVIQVSGWGVKGTHYYINHNGVLQMDSDKVVGGVALC